MKKNIAYLFNCNTRQRLFISLQVAAFLLVGSVVKSQAVFTSAATGNWNTASSWTLVSGSDADGVPDANDNVTISNNKDITITASATCKDLTVNGNISNETTQLNVNIGVTLSVSGNFSIDGNNPQKKAGITVDGKIQFAGTVLLGSTNVTYLISAGSNVEFNGGAQSVPAIPGSVVYSNLILSGTGNKTIENGVTVNTMLSMQGTAVAVSGFIKYGANATLEYKGSGPQITSKAEFPSKGNNSPDNLIINNASGVTLYATKSINNLSLVSGNLSTEAFTLTVAGVLSRNTGTIALSAGTLVLSGTTVQNIPVGFFASNVAKNITIDNAAGVILNESIALTGALLINSGMLFSPVSTAVVSGTGILSGTGIIKVTRAGGTNDLSNQYSLVRTLTNLTIEYAGAAIQSADPVSYDNLKISNYNDVVLNGNATVSITLTLNTGCLRIGSNTLTLNGTVVRNSGYLIGSHTASLVIGGNAGNLYFNNIGTGNYLKNLTINTASKATLATALNITGGTATNNEGTLTVPGTGVLTTGGLLTIKSNQFGTARIAAGNTAGGYISGNVTVERFIPRNTNKGWRLLAAPTSGQTIKQAWQESQTALANANPGYGAMIASNGLNLAAVQALGFDSLSPGASLFKYNPLTDNLDPIINTSATLISSEQGYFLFVRGDRSPGQMGTTAGNIATTNTILRSKGTVYQGNQPAINVLAGRYGLIRNPYASALDLTKIVLGGGMVKAYQVWDPKLNGAFGTGAYQTFTQVGANFLITPGGGSYGASGSVNNFIESGSAFFMQAVSSNGSIAINENCKATGSHMAFRPGGNLSADEMLITNLYVEKNGTSDLVDGNLVVFDNTVSNEVDVDDVKKSPNFAENIGILKSNTDLVVEKRPVINADDTLQYNLYQVKRLNYKLEIIPANFSHPELICFLLDKYTGSSTVINLTDTTFYNFTVNANAASSSASRFSLVFKMPGVLAVNFIAVNATRQNNNVAVKWEVADQININRYEVEKSADGRNFNVVAYLQANSATVNYNWLDENAVVGTNYYRIKSADNNSQFQYSNIVKVLRGKVNLGTVVSPNPVHDNLVNIQFVNQQAGKYSVRLVNVQGQIVYSKTALCNAGNTSQSISLPASVANGVYQFQVLMPDNSMQVQKVIVDMNN